MSRGGDHPSLEQLPIPEDAAVGKGWTEQMVEMADHIGAYATLRVVEAFGGQYLYIAEDPEQNRLRDVIGPEKAAIMSHVYGRERLRIPTARSALLTAKRQPVLAAVRANALSSYEAARILGTTQPYLSHLINHSEEGTGASLPPRFVHRKPGRDGRQLDFFGEEPDALR